MRFSRNRLCGEKRHSPQTMPVTHMTQPMSDDQMMNSVQSGPLRRSGVK